MAEEAESVQCSLDFPINVRSIESECSRVNRIEEENARNHEVKRSHLERLYDAINSRLAWGGR